MCDNLDYHDVCRVCSDDSRTDEIIAVVETVAELWAIERSGTFQGRYHVLGNPASAKSRTTDALKLDHLRYRCQNSNTTELILATNSTLEGQTTAFFITEYFKDTSIKITRLASGIPMGGELDYLDEGTLSAALEKRIIF